MTRDKLVFAGGMLIAAGILLIIMARFKIPFLLGRLPGDFLIKRPNMTVYIPLATSILVSVVISVILYFFSRR